MFKKMSLLAFVIILSSSFIIAQNPLKQGVYRAGGEISFSSGSTEDKYDYNLGIGDERISVNLETKSISLVIHPSFSYFITDNILIGGSIGFSYLQTKRTIEDSYLFTTNTSNSTNIHRSFDIGPTLRYYFSAEKFIPFIGVGALYAKYLGEDVEGKYVYGEVGVNYFFASSAALEPFLSYRISTIGPSNNTSKDFSVGVGFMYYIIP